MTKGTIYPAESSIFCDAETGAHICQVTRHPSVHHHPFFFVPAYDNGMKRLFFISYRTGVPQVFAQERAGGRLIQLTDRTDLDEWSLYPARNHPFILFTAGGAGWQLDVETLRETRIVDFGNEVTREEGMVGGAMGTSALSPDERWWAVPVKTGDHFKLFMIDLQSGDNCVILARDKIGHPQFCPEDNSLILYLATMTDPLWVFNRESRVNFRVYRRNVEKKEWITHASWIPGRREVCFVDWPHGVRAVHVDTGAQRQVTRFNVWHAVCSPDGQRMVADTNCPDIGLQLFNPLDGIGKPSVLCHPRASQIGEHWKGPFPYDTGPVKVYAPQHTHPHPSFAPDRSRIVYTSDRTGHAQIYECLLSQE